MFKVFRYLIPLVIIFVFYSSFFSVGTTTELPSLPKILLTGDADEVNGKMSAFQNLFEVRKKLEAYKKGDTNSMHFAERVWDES